MNHLPPLSLYIHTPWCVKKCPYCDFNSHKQDEIPVTAYLEALKKDLAMDMPLVQGRDIATVFIGGGTPSLMPASFYQDLFSHLRSELNFAQDAEITMEANPGTLDEANFAGFRQAGINRLSIGVQSFDDQQLANLGRIHQQNDVLRCVEVARQVGFDNINLDLMFALKEQSLEQALADLRQAIDLQPEHLSWYQLTIEQNTEFFRNPPKQPDDESIWAMHQAGIELLADAGFMQYEISAFSQANKQSRHNLNYWQFGDYLGIGAGAHGKSSFTDGRIQRNWKTRLPKDYLMADRISYGQTEVIKKDEQAFEFMMNALRLKQGVPQAYFEQRTALNWQAVEPIWQQLIKQGLVHQQHGRIATTKQGFDYLNEVIEAFL